SGRQFLAVPNLARSRLWLWSHTLYDTDHTATNITYAWPASPRSVQPSAGLPDFYTISTRIQNAEWQRSWRLTPRHKSAPVPYVLLPALLHHLLSSRTPTRASNIFRRGGSSRWQDRGRLITGPEPVLGEIRKLLPVAQSLLRLGRTRNTGKRLASVSTR